MTDWSLKIPTCTTEAKLLVITVSQQCPVPLIFDLCKVAPPTLFCSLEVVTIDLFSTVLILSNACFLFHMYCVGMIFVNH